jgi:hypothetical protein
MVAVTVLLVAALYVMVFGLTGTASNKAPVGRFTPLPVAGGYKLSFTPFIPATRWSDVYILVLAGGQSAAFTNISTADLSSSTAPVTKHLGGQPLGNITVFMNVTDLAGNGRVDGGDSFTLTTGGGMFSSALDYQVIMMHRPSSTQIYATSIQGS